jgi:FtsH-binding integral membrane protein
MVAALILSLTEQTMFESLLAKTLAILSLQLLITWGAAELVLRWVRHLYDTHAAGVTASKNDAGELDLDLDWTGIRPWFWALIVADIGVFILLLIFGAANLALGLSLFAVWSVLTGIELALALLSVDENLGGRVLALTAATTAICALIATRSGLNFSFLGPILFIALLGLLLVTILRLFYRISTWAQRVTAGFGIVIFIGYLLFDFSRAANLDRAENNTWTRAMSLAIDIYLDIVNLFLQILDLLSDNS